MNVVTGNEKIGTVPHHHVGLTSPVLFARLQIAVHPPIGTPLASIFRCLPETRTCPYLSATLPVFCSNKLCELLVYVLQLICQLKVLKSHG